MGLSGFIVHGHSIIRTALGTNILETKLTAIRFKFLLIMHVFWSGSFHSSHAISYYFVFSELDLVHLTITDQ